MSQHACFVQLVLHDEQTEWYSCIYTSAWCFALSFKQNIVSWSSLITCSFWSAMYFLLFSHFEWILETSFILKHVYSVEPWVKLDVGFHNERYRHAKSLKWCRSKVCIVTVCKCDCRISSSMIGDCLHPCIWSQPLVHYLFLYTSCNLYVLDQTNERKQN